MTGAGRELNKMNTRENKRIVVNASRNRFLGRYNKIMASATCMPHARTLAQYAKRKR